MLDGERINASLPRVRNKTKHKNASTLLTQYSTRSKANVTGQEKEINFIQIGKEETNCPCLWMTFVYV